MSCIRRLDREIDRKVKPRYFDYDKGYSLIKMGYQDRNIFGLLNDKTGEMEIELIVPSTYPFHTPDVYLEKTSLIKFQSIKNGYTNYMMRVSNYRSWSGYCMKNLDEQTRYKAWLMTIIRYPKMSKMWMNPPGIKTCLCCESILCKDNWAPSFTLYDVCSEYILRKTFFIYTSNLIQKQIDRILMEVFRNDKWDLCDDLIIYILSFCYEFSNKIEIKQLEPLVLNEKAV